MDNSLDSVQPWHILMAMEKRLFPLLLLFYTFFCSSCFLLTDNTANVSGIISPVEQSRSLSESRSIGSAVSHIGAFSITTGGDFGTVLPKREEQVNSDGSFSIPLSKNDDYILLLLNKWAGTKEELISGYIAINSGDNNLILFPGSGIVEDLNLGFLEPSAGEYVSEFGLTDKVSSYSISLETLRELAKIDSVFKGLSNTYRNQDIDNGLYYHFQTEFSMYGDLYSSLQTYTVVEEYTYGGYRLNMTTNNTFRLDYAAIANGEEIITVIPPTDIFIHGDDNPFNQERPFTNDGAVVTSDLWEEATATRFTNGIISGRYYNGVLHFDVGTGASLSGTPPSGLWYYETNGETFALAETSIISPLTPDEKVFLPVPSIRCITDSQGRLESIDVQWYILDGETYLPVNNSDLFTNYFSDYYIVLEDADGLNSNGGLRIHENSTEISSTYQFTEDWHIRDNHTEDVLEVDYLHIDFSIHNIGMHFSFNRR